MKNILLIGLSIFLITAYSLAQPINKSEIGTVCNSYQFNYKNVKIKFPSSYFIPFKFEINETEINSEKFLAPVNGCNNPLTIVFKESFTTDLNLAISEYLLPTAISETVYINITQFDIQANLLPTLNPRLILGFEFLNKDDKILHSRYVSSTIVNNASIEKPIGKILKLVIREFIDGKIYSKKIPFTSEQDSTKMGIYTSHTALVSNKPNIELMSAIVNNPLNGINRFSIPDLKSKEKVDVSWIYAIHDSTSLYLNMANYYPKKYFVKLEKLDSQYYFGFDKILDYTQASRNTMAFGGGLIGVIAGQEAAKAQSCILFNMDNGEIRAFPPSEIKKLLRGNEAQFNGYKTALGLHNYSVLKAIITKLYFERKQELMGNKNTRL